MIVTSRPSLRTQTHLSCTCAPSRLGTCSAATKRVGIPMLEEHFGVGVQEAGEPSNGVGGTVCAMVVVPARHLAFVLVASHVRGDADDRLVDVAVAETTPSIRGAVLDLVPRLQFEAFVAECWVPNSGIFIWVVEGNVVFIGRALGSSDGWHAAATGRGTCGRLRVDIIENASGEPRVDEATTRLEQGIIVHSDVLFQGLESRAKRGPSSGLGAEPYDFCCDSGVIDGVDVLVH